ncbi:MAG: efflux RND transporter permease subunit [Rhodospirillaceae bacterium]|jgi:heavy-metal exporter, HME family|nr:efflux RND transporter permease subunit [Rhodospirillaceae bacterium]MBT6137909.1 efflux RND transporter permease subunit [Rhodospirillaceae bacterium]
MFALAVNSSLRHRLFVLVAALGLIIYGAVALREMPIDVLPDLTRPMVTLMTESEGLSPEEVEALITYPIEAGLSGLPGLSRVRSISGAGLSIVFLEFEWNIDVYRARQFVVERLEPISEELPPGITPFMTPVSSVMGEVMLVALTATETTPMQLRELVDWVLRPRLLAIGGVAQVIPIGGEVKEYRITPDLGQMQLLDISLDELADALVKFGQNTGGGFVDQNDKEFVIRNVGRTKRLDDLRALTVSRHGSVSTPLSQLARVEIMPKVKRGDAGYNGAPAVVVSIAKQPGIDTVTLVDKINAAMDEIGENLPEDVEVGAIIYNQADFIKTSINNVEQVLMEATVVVIIVLFLFLANARTTFISLTAIPISILVTVLVMKGMGLTINTMTLGGMAIAIGELVDDAVVGVENVFRRLRQNSQSANPRPVIRVVAEASQEVRSGIFIATVIIVMVLVPLYALSGLEGRMFAPFATAYIIAMLASLATAVTVTPALCYYLLPSLKRLHGDDSMLLSYLKRINRVVVGFALDHSRVVMIGAVLLLAVSGTSVIWMPRVFMPTMIEGAFVVQGELNPGISLEMSNQIGITTENLIKQVPGVVAVGRRTGRAELDEHANGVNVSEIEVRIRLDGRTQSEIKRDIRNRLSVLPLRFIIEQPLAHRIDHMISGVRAKIALKIFGDDLGTLTLLANEFERRMKLIPAIGDVAVETQARTPQIRINVDHEMASAFGITPSAVTEALETLAMGAVVSEIIQGERRFDVVLRLSDADRTSSSLEGMMVETPSGRVALSTFASIEETDGVTNIMRENTRRRIVVRANATSREMTDAIEGIRQVMAEMEMPAGYFTNLEGSYQAQEEASKSIAGLALVSLAMIFVVLYSRYHNISLVLVIMAIIPLAMIGGIIGLWVMSEPLSIASMFGFVTLAGISARNGILKVSHYINLVLHEGETFGRDLILRGSDERLAPVLMTTLAAGVALVPLLFGAQDPGKEILHPVAVVIFFGLIVAVTLDAMLTPVLFHAFGRKPLDRLLAERDEMKVQEAF